MARSAKKAAEIYQGSFDRRLERLMKFHELDAPVSIMCLSLALLFKAAVLLYGMEFWKALHHGIVGWLSVGIGICPHCYGDYRTFPVCGECLKAEEESAERMEKELDDAADPGS